MNDMELTPDDQKVVDLLSKLKNSNGTYPSDILETRRQTYLKQVANIGLGIGTGAGLKNGAKSGNGAGAVATATSKILEIALIAAITIEVGTATYLYRDKIADLIKKNTASANVQEVAPSPNGASSLSLGLTETLESPSATITAITPSNTPSVTPSVTPGPELAGGNNGTNSSVNATPQPGGNNGNQYGLTPKPVRTKDNNDTNTDGNNNGGGSNNGGTGGKNNKP